MSNNKMKGVIVSITTILYLIVYFIYHRTMENPNDFFAVFPIIIVAVYLGTRWVFFVSACLLLGIFFIEIIAQKKMDINFIGHFKILEFMASVFIGIIIGELIKEKEKLKNEIIKREEAEKKNTLLANAVEQSSSTIVITDLSGKIEYVNKKFTEVTGYSRDEAIGNNPKIMKSGIQSSEFYKQMWNTIIAGNEWKGEFSNKRKNGEIFWENAYISPVKNESGEVIKFIAVKEDITEKRKLIEKLKDSEEKFMQINTAAQDAIIMVDENQNIVYSNKKAEEIFLYNSAELYNKKIDEIVDFEDIKEKANYKKNIETTGRKKDNTEIPIEISMSKVLQSGSQNNVIIVREISERKEAEALIKKGQEEIERAKDYAEKASLAKSEFLANMSHEIRTPMNSILGFASVLLEEENDYEKRDKLETINIAGKNLMLLINDILDFSKIEAGKIEIVKSEFSIKSVLNHLKNLFFISSKEKNINYKVLFTANVPNHIMGDEYRINQILTNLLGNSFKFTAKGTIELKCDYVSGQLIITVQDTGIGIAKEKQEKIFDAFEQADSSVTKRYSGTGLGLSICRKLVQKMDGEINVFSEEGKGSIFTVIIPAEEIKGSVSQYEDQIVFKESRDIENEKNKKEENDEVVREIKVLVVEDNKINQKLMSVYMSKVSGIKCDFADDGQEGIDKLRNNKYDIVVMDIQMPVMNGFEAIKNIRNNSELKNIPVIALTANVLQKDKEEAFQAGFDDFIAKPVDKQELIEKINLNFNKKR